MAKTIAVINHKGGVGKSTTSVGIATVLAGAHDKKVLLVDLDPQANSTLMLIGENRYKEINDQGQTLYKLIYNGMDGFTRQAIPAFIERRVGNIRDVTSLDLLPSSMDLIQLEDKIIYAAKRAISPVDPTRILFDAMGGIDRLYDYIIIDCPPSLGIVTLNGLRICDGIIIPTIPDIVSTYGIPQIISHVNKFAESINRYIPCYGIIATKVRSNCKLHENTIDMLKKGTDAPLFKAMIFESSRIGEAAEYHECNTLRQKWGYAGQYDQFNSLAVELMWRANKQS